MLWFFVPTGIGIDIHLDPPIGIGTGTWTATYCTAGRNYQPSLVLVCFPHCRFRDLITSNQSGRSIEQQTILAAEVPFILLHKLFGFFSSPFLSFKPPQQEAQSTDRRRGSSERGRACCWLPCVCFVCPAGQNQVSPSLSSSRLCNRPPGLLVSSSHKLGGSFEALGFRKGVWVTTVSSPCTYRIIVQIRFDSIAIPSHRRSLKGPWLEPP